MEPLDEKELSRLLREWKAPDAPPSLERRVVPQPAQWWRWLFTGTIRIPVPVGIAAIVIIAMWILLGRPDPVPVAQPSASTTLADFQPVNQLELTIVERNDDNQTK
jgi:hypothetical protein